MRLASFIVWFAALGLGRVGLAEPSARIVLCDEPAGVCRAGQALGQTAAVRWVTLDDKALLAARPTPVVLYFSSRQYDEAMAGLGGKEREQAVLRRREVVTGNLSGFLFEQLTSDLAQVAATAKGNDRGILLEAAAVLDGSERRLRGARPGELLDMAREDLAELLVELPKGPLVDRFAKEVDAVGALAAEVRKDPGHARLPFAEPVQAYLVPSLPEKQLSVLRELAAYPHKWHGGVVVLLGDHQLAQPPFKGQALKPLYPGRQDYLGDLTELTTPQLHRRLEARLRQGYDRPAFIARRAFQHAVFYRALTVQFEEARAAWLAEWRKVVAMDTDNLGQVLAPTAPRSDPAGKPERAQLRGDISLVAAILPASASPTRHAAMLARATESLSHLSP